MNNRISRRDALVALGSTIIASHVSAQARPALTIVLVHGAWHGGWCWRKVVPLLRETGHAVFTPTLTGLGERRHLANPTVGLDVHVQDITALLEAEDLRSVVLVGHSYGGLVIGGVAQRQRDRLRQLVFLDAFVPEPGRSLQDAIPNVRFDEIAKKSGDGWRVPMSAVFPSLSALGVRDQADVAWMEPRIVDQPVRTFTEPSSIMPDTLRAIPCGYILASSSAAFVQTAERCRNLGWPVRLMQDAGHDAMVTKPAELVELLAGLLATAA